jgi:hypothetical protein
LRSGAEAAVECTFPVAEATPTSVLIAAGSGTTLIFTFIINLLSTPAQIVYFLVGSMGLAMVILLFFNGPYRRLEYERSGGQRLN